MRCDVFYETGRGIIVVSPDGSSGVTPAQPLIDALAARTGAFTFLMAGEEEFLAGDMDASIDINIARPREVYLVRGNVSLAPERRAEIGLQVGGALTVLAADPGVLVAPDGPERTDYWTPSQRPVLTVSSAEGLVALRVHSRTAIDAAPRGTRLAQYGSPDWSAQWDPSPISVLDDVDEAGRLQDDFRATLTAGSTMDEAVLAELGIDSVRLEELLGAPLSETTLAEVLDVCGFPAETEVALRGELASVAGSIPIRQRGLWETIVAGMSEEPAGTSLLARWRRIPHRHPRFAVALVICELLLAALLIFAAIAPPHFHPLTAVQYVLAGIFLIDAVVDAMLLRVIRRRKAEIP